MDKKIPDGVVLTAAYALSKEWNLHYPDAVRMAALVLSVGQQHPEWQTVGVEGLLADLETIWHSVSDDKETNAAYQRLKSALAQQPAAVDEATRLLRAYRGAPKFSNDHNAIKQTCALEDEIDLFLATQRGGEVT